jgi:acetyltransferase-like isoleucine patch superfamily enzyme
LLNGLWVIADAEITIGSYGLISWNVVVMDTYRAARDAALRREQLRAFAAARDPQVFSAADRGDGPRPVIIEDNVWIGFDCCILPGVRIGAGSVIGARSVVDSDIPSSSVAAGNPAKVIRSLVGPEAE